MTVFELVEKYCDQGVHPLAVLQFLSAMGQKTGEDVLMTAEAMESVQACFGEVAE